MHQRDAVLLDRWTQSGDAEAFREIVVRYAGLVYTTAHRVLRDPAAAEDIAQDAFLTLAKGSRVERALGPWLHRVATNKSLDALKSDIRRRKRETDWTTTRGAATTPEWDDVREFLDEAINDLPDAQRTVVIGHFLYGKSHEELAAGLGITRSAVTRRIAKGVERIRATLERRGVPIASAALTTLLSANAIEAAPTTLLAKLSEIALVGPAALSAHPHVGRASGGIAMNKGLALLGLVAIVAAGFWFLTRTDTPDATNPETLSDAQALPDSAAPLRDASTESVEDTLADDVQAEATIEASGDGERVEDPPEVSRVINLVTREGIAGVTIYGHVLPEGAELQDLSSGSGVPLLAMIFPENPNLKIGDALPGGLQVSAMTRINVRPSDEDVRGVPTRSQRPLALLSVDPNASMPALPTIGTTGPEGEIILNEIEPGRYGIVAGPLGYYMGSTPLEVTIKENRPEPAIEISMMKGAVIEGIAKINGKPLINRQFDLQKYGSASAGQSGWSAQTGANGHYKVEGISVYAPEVDAIFFGELTIEDGSQRESLYVKATLESGRTTTIDVSFALGAASIEGRVYRAADNSPMPCAVNLLWQYADNDSTNRDRVEIRTNEEGYFLAENLLPGPVLVEVFPGFEGSLKHRKLVELVDGTRVQADFPHLETFITVRARNVPEGRTQAVLAIPGEFEIPSPMTSWEQFMQIEDAMSCVGFMDGNLGYLNGMAPGRYTIVASVLPTGPYIQDYLAMGDEYLKQVRRVYAFVDLPEENPNITVDLEFNEQQ